jgi:hypothetical protein
MRKKNRPVAATIEGSAAEAAGYYLKTGTRFAFVPSESLIFVGSCRWVSRTMFFRERVPRRQDAIAALLMVLAVVFVLAVSTEYVSASRPSGLSQDMSTVKMIFHMYSPVLSNSNSSIFVYNGVDTNPPIYATAPTVMVSCAIHHTFQSYFAGIDAWVGLVAWITQPLSEETLIQGNVSMTVWMSTSDPSPTGSGYAFGLSEVDSHGNLIGEQFYQYTYGLGNTLSQTPGQYTLVFAVNRTFAKGSILAFFVGVGSTTQGWHYQVYFDSPSMDSFAQVPIASTPVPEFPQLGAILSMAVAMLFFGVICRRKR